MEKVEWVYVKGRDSSSIVVPITGGAMSQGLCCAGSMVSVLLKQFGVYILLRLRGVVESNTSSKSGPPTHNVLSSFLWDGRSI